MVDRLTPERRSWLMARIRGKDTLPERRTMIFGERPHLASDPRRAERELFARIPYIQPGT